MLERIIVPGLELRDKLLLSLVNGSLKPANFRLCGAQVVIGRSIRFLKLFHFLQKLKLIFVDYLLWTIFAIQVIVLHSSHMIVHGLSPFVLLLVKVNFDNIDVLLCSIALLS